MVSLPPLPLRNHGHLLTSNRYLKLQRDLQKLLLGVKCLFAQQIPSLAPPPPSESSLVLSPEAFVIKAEKVDSSIKKKIRLRAAVKRFLVVCATPQWAEFSCCKQGGLPLSERNGAAWKANLGMTFGFIPPPRHNI